MDEWMNIKINKSTNQTGNITVTVTVPRGVEANAVHVPHKICRFPVLIRQRRPLRPRVEVRRNFDVVLQ